MIAALLRQDLGLGFSSGAALPLIFAGLVITLFGVGLAQAPDEAAFLAPTIFWVSLLLSALLNLERLIQPDLHDGTLDLLLLELGALPLALAKILVHWLTSLLPLLLLLPLAGLFLSLPWDLVTTLGITLAIGSPALSALATLGAALTLVARRGAMLAPVLLLPLLVPVFLFGIGAVIRQAQGGSPLEGIYFLAAASVLALLIAPLAVAGALKLAVE